MVASMLWLLLLRFLLLWLLLLGSWLFFLKATKVTLQQFPPNPAAPSKALQYISMGPLMVTFSKTAK